MADGAKMFTSGVNGPGDAVSVRLQQDRMNGAGPVCLMNFRGGLCSSVKVNWYDEDDDCRKYYQQRFLQNINKLYKQLS